MGEVLLLYSTVDGQTPRICERLRHGIEQGGHGVVLASLHEELRADLARFDKIVVGASVRYGKHRQQVYRFVADHAAALRNRPTAFLGQRHGTSARARPARYQSLI